ncbi:expressed unknown protein [Seminavis robusta]|uniref:Peptidase M50B-like-domain-containing protein n=1 Tax=Seminavis robusta TaxID=568900 RepID=A0A9N8ES96_9STRA|nr:expressed unknown protein [Seminavis robusta]|eukprot:Sro1552_g281790.1 n/a (259) ;mRNA; r:11472-12472
MSEESASYTEQAEELFTEYTSQIDWTLSQWGTEETIFICFYAGYFVLNYCLWNTVIVKPMALIAVFTHEMCHATACWLTCGKVVGIEVYGNEGGVAKYTGGCRCLIIPAGYVGGAFWGGAFVALSGNRIGATVAGSIFTAALLISLRYSPNSTVVWLSVGFTVITVAAILVDWLYFDPFIQYIVLYYGVFIGVYSVRDIYDDLIVRTAEGSDAVACYNMCPMCLPRCVGVQWGIIGLAFQFVGLYIALCWLSSTGIGN